MNNPTKKHSLEELMVAMDVVDTLRHQQQLVDRELDAEARRERLIEKLRDIYASQGLEVTDEMLEEGVRALEEERFQYRPPEPSFSHRLANLYIRRDKWLKPLVTLLMVIFLLLLFYDLFVAQPQDRRVDNLPAAITQEVSAINRITNDSEALQKANELRALANQAVHSKDYRQAEERIDQLRALQNQLVQSYRIRILQRSGEVSGVWRVPDVNSRARNYYLIVEAIDAKGDALYLPITSEETGKTRNVNQWGVRVDVAFFERVKRDKSDDGIIQQREIGRKAAGEYKPVYSAPILGGMITEW